MQELASEMNLICSIASIPVMEPLNSYRLNKIMLLTLGCVDIAMYAASGYFTTTAIGTILKFIIYVGACPHIYYAHNAHSLLFL